MMSVLIKGMKMPKTCEACPLGEESDSLYYSCYPQEWAYTHDPKSGRMPNCPLIEISTPHGRLIDADALAADLKRQCKEVFKTDAVSPDDFWVTRNQAYNERLWTTWCESLFDYLKAVPTIIPAEEGE